MQKKKKINLDYLAGFFDGEGCFYLGKQFKNGKAYPKAQVMLSQSGFEGLLLLQDIQADYGGSIYHHLKAGQYKATQDAYKLYWNKDEAITLCNELIPYLRLKQQAAQEVLNYLTRNQ